jgi:hypothetical protein
VRDLPAGWLIPIAILFIISFPPLFGHEIIALLCGVVYGLWIGFAIVAAGTFTGESKLSSDPHAQILAFLTNPKKQLARGSLSSIFFVARRMSWNARILIMAPWHD